jgi:MarR family transcriptional regulator, organic hydroperoxide resistance regulator
MAAKHDDVPFLLSRVARSHRTLSANLLAPLGLHPGQDSLLRCLWSDDGQTQSDLVEQLGVEAPTVTKMVHRLEAAGFVTRRSHPTDRRATQVWLTTSGRAIRSDVQKVRNRVNRRLSAGLSPRQQSTLVGLLNKLNDNLADD